MSAQRLHFREDQLYTTLHGRPEDIAAVLTHHSPELVAEIIKRFNAHEKLVSLLKDVQAVVDTTDPESDNFIDSGADSIDELCHVGERVTRFLKGLK